jgi:hypothetical protein
MAVLELSPPTVEIDSLEVFSNPFDVRRDLHAFVSYVKDRQIKRSHRENALPKGDVKRLLKMLSDSGARERFDEESREDWLARVDELALALGFVSYNTKGTYAGHSSQQESFPDNYIRLNAEGYKRFLALPPVEQEEAILAALVGACSYSDNEFFMREALGRLDRFNTWGCGTGVLPGIDFSKVRRILLDVLSHCRPGTWYETASLVRHMKDENPWFLIPAKPGYKYPSDRKDGRYGNFHESKERWGHEIKITEADPDAFERVEGRYIERFLEGIPLQLSYVEVAYGESTARVPYPSLNRLRAFRVTETFPRIARREIRPPRVTVQPDFSIHIESELYPASVMEKLTPLADTVAIDKVSILKLNRRKVAALLAGDGSLDVVKLLTGLSGMPLPQNVRAEIEEWAGHSEAFTVYEGFGLWEGKADLPRAKTFHVRDIVPGEARRPFIRIVRSPLALFEALEQAELVPVLARHRKAALVHMPEGTVSVFRSRSRRPASVKEKKAPVNVSRATTASLFFPTETLVEECRKAMIQAGCPIEVEPSRKMVSYAVCHSALAEAGLKIFGKKYDLRIQEVEP